MASRRWGLETWKFAIYLAVPIAVSCYLTKPEMLIKVIKQKQYIVFPPEENAVDEATTQKLSDQIQKLKEKGEE